MTKEKGETAKKHLLEEYGQKRGKYFFKILVLQKRNLGAEGKKTDTAEKAVSVEKTKNTYSAPVACAVR
jgi:hypothetical protein